jgi:nucleotide-binding universal stress UspA family protein
LFKKIIVPLDGSKHSTTALEKAIQIAKKFEGKITLIHAYSPHILTKTTPEIIEAFLEAGNKILAEGEAKAKAEGLRVKKILKAGRTVDTIVEAAGKGKCDLIVMGARGLSPIKVMLLGSVSYGVTTHASCPVLIVR